MYPVENVEHRELPGSFYQRREWTSGKVNIYVPFICKSIIIKIKVIQIKIGINVSKISKETYKSISFSARLNPSELRSFFLINSVVRVSHLLQMLTVLYQYPC